jgi:hypothetical protein
MVRRAEHEQVVEVGLAAIGPVLDVVNVQVALVVATRKHARAIAGE